MSCGKPPPFSPGGWAGSLTGRGHVFDDDDDDDDENECLNVKDQLFEYADATTIHGIKYTLEKGRLLVER